MYLNPWWLVGGVCVILCVTLINYGYQRYQRYEKAQQLKFDEYKKHEQQTIRQQRREAERR